MPLLLLDLDNTVADRAAAFECWMARKLSAWAPSDPSARAFLIREDTTGFDRETTSSLPWRSGCQLDVSGDALLSEYRRLTLCGFPPMSDEVSARLTSTRRAGWKVGLVTDGETEVQEATAERIGLLPLLDGVCRLGGGGNAQAGPSALRAGRRAVRRGAGRRLDGR
jgi:putative hydrolase of the HAD superfamily